MAFRYTSVLNLFRSRCGSGWLVQLRRPIQRNGTFFYFNVTARIDLQVDGAIVIYFVYNAVDAGNGYHLIAFLQAFNKRFLLLGFFSLRPDEKQPEHHDHQSKKNKLESAET